MYAIKCIMIVDKYTLFIRMFWFAWLTIQQKGTVAGFFTSILWPKVIVLIESCRSTRNLFAIIIDVLIIGHLLIQVTVIKTDDFSIVCKLPTRLPKLRWGITTQLSFWWGYCYSLIKTGPISAWEICPSPALELIKLA